MQNYRTILEVIKLRCVEILSRSVCQGKVKLGNGTYQLIEEKFKESGKTYEQTCNKRLLYYLLPSETRT